MQTKTKISLVSYVFLCPHTFPLPANIYYLIVPEGQEPGSGLLGWFWLGFPHEVTAKLSARVAVISRLNGSWRIRFQAALRGCWQEASVSHWLLARGLHSSPHGPLHRMFRCPQDVKAGSPWGIGPNEKERERVCVIKIAPKTEATVNLISEWWTITSAVSYSSHKPPLVECGSGLHEDVNTGRWGSSRAIVESGCHSLKQRYQMTVQTAVSPQPWKQKLH